MSWFSDFTARALANLPPRQLSPSLIFEFDDVREVVAMVEGSIIAKREKMEAQRQRSIQDAAADPFRDFATRPLLAAMAEPLWQIEWTFPRIARSALLIAICSHVEHALGEWCELLRFEWRLAPVPKRPRNVPDVLHYMNYLKDVPKLVDDFEIWPEWPLLEGYRAARNCLAHNGGMVERASDRTKIACLSKVFVDDDATELLSRGPLVVIREGACEEAVDTAKTFFDRLHEICQRDPRAKPSPKAP
jgi:hypothetical protein